VKEARVEGAFFPSVEEKEKIRFSAPPPLPFSGKCGTWIQSAGHFALSPFSSLAYRR